MDARVPALECLAVAARKAGQGGVELGRGLARAKSSFHKELVR